MTGYLSGHPKAMWRLMAADFLARTAYQIGKTPVLPVYAAMLGASDMLIGYVVSMSTLTGLVLKPLVGALSDRTARRGWMILGLVLFAGVPFLYRFVETPNDLYVLRFLHGTATAIFGPISLAYLAEMGCQHRATRLGIFGMSRSASYLIAPLAGAILLLRFTPEQVFTIIGLLSCLALIPALGLPESRSNRTKNSRATIRQMAHSIGSSRAFWLVVVLEISVYSATYALKAFLPIYAMRTLELDITLIGLYFTLQEIVHLIVRPIAGKFADTHGAESVIFAGFVALASAFLVIGLTESTASLLLGACGIGLGLGMILPSTLALLACEVRGDSLGAGMGALGATRNFAKILGPVTAGTVLMWVSYQGIFLLAGGMLMLTALGLGLHRAIQPDGGVTGS